MSPRPVSRRGPRGPGVPGPPGAPGAAPSPAAPRGAGSRIGAATERFSPGWLAAGAAVLLTLLLHSRALFVGFTEEDLGALDAVLRTPLAALLSGGALPGRYTPLSFELHLWWWWRIVGLDALGLHVVAAVVAAGALILVRRLAERWAGGRAGWMALLLLLVFPPLGGLLAWVSGGRELVGLLWSAAALLWHSRGQRGRAAVAAGAAAMSSESAALLVIALALADHLREPGASLPRRLARVAPALTAVGLALGAAAWLGPWRPPLGLRALGLPGDLVRACLQPGTLSGLETVWRATPWAIPAAAILGALAVPRVQARPAGFGAPRGAIALGLAWGTLALLPLATAASPQGGDRFLLPALGFALAAAALAASGPAWLGRALVAIAAVGSLGANAYAPLSASEGGPMAGAVGAAAVRERAERIAPWTEALRPACRDLGATTRAFLAGVEPDSALLGIPGAAARIACRNRDVTVRFLAEFSPADAGAPFGVLRPDRLRRRFLFERADAHLRASIGEGFLLFARYEVAAACFEAAAAERPADPELVYPRVMALASSGREVDARHRWEEALRAGAAPAADTLASRLLAGLGPAAADSARPVTRRLIARVLADPTDAAPHLALGQHLLALGLARSATLEFAVASGIRRLSQDLYWLARGYDAMGSVAEARETYRVALTGGLEPEAYARARDRYLALSRTSRAPPAASRRGDEGRGPRREASPAAP